MIRLTINILPFVFTYFIIFLRNEENVTMILKTVTFLCKTISTYWYTTLIKEYKSIVNGLIKTI